MADIPVRDVKTCPISEPFRLFADLLDKPENQAKICKSDRDSKEYMELLAKVKSYAFKHMDVILTNLLRNAGGGRSDR